MLELAAHGAKVLHNRSVEMAKKYGVQLVVRSSLNENEGTIVKETVKMERMLVTGVAGEKDIVRISVIGIVINRVLHLEFSIHLQKIKLISILFCSRSDAKEQRISPLL